MRRSAVIIAALATMLVSVPTASSLRAEPTPPNFKVSLVGTIVDGGSTCCITFWFFEGSAVVPMLGLVTFEGEWAQGGVQFSDPPLRHRSLSLRLESSTGDTLLLSGVTQWLATEPMPPLTWTVSEGTGRFASYSGSGTYTTANVDGTVRITLSGTLLRAS
jgi:hypothetical protein